MDSERPPRSEPEPSHSHAPAAPSSVSIHRNDSLPNPPLRPSLERPTLKVVRTPEDRERVFRFWYDIYVTEMNRRQNYADHSRRRVCDPLDAHSHILLAEARGDVVGTVRMNLGRETDFGAYTELFGFRSLVPAYPNRMSISGKYMVRADYRNTRLPLRIGVAMFAYLLQQDIDVNAIDCNPHLEATYLGCGYVPYWKRVDHPEYGNVLPMRLDLRNHAHLHAIGSPFVRDWLWNDLPEELRMPNPTRSTPAESPLSTTQEPSLQQS